MNDRLLPPLAAIDVNGIGGSIRVDSSEFSDPADYRRCMDEALTIAAVRLNGQADVSALILFVSLVRPPALPS